MNSMPIIQEILSDRRRFMSLLLLADEQESMVERYLARGRMFVMYSFGILFSTAGIWTQDDGFFV